MTFCLNIRLLVSCGVNAERTDEKCANGPQPL